MKSLIAYLLITFVIVGAGAETAPRVEPIPRQTLGNIAYYVIPESKQIWLELPYQLKGTVISADNVHSLNIFAQTDKNLNREEISALRGQYPGYKLREAVIIGKDWIDVDLGINKKITLAEDPSGHAGFFSAEVLLTSAEAQALKNKIKAQQFPVIQLAVKRSVPYEKVLESVELPTKRICDQLVQASGNQPLRFARGLSLLFGTISQELKKVQTQLLLNRAVELLVDTCVVTEIDGETKLGRVPISFDSKKANATDILKNSLIEEIPASVSAVIESEWKIL